MTNAVAGFFLARRNHIADDVRGVAVFTFKLTLVLAAASLVLSVPELLKSVAAGSAVTLVAFVASHAIRRPSPSHG